MTDKKNPLVYTNKTADNVRCLSCTTSDRGQWQCKHLHRYRSSCKGPKMSGCVQKSLLMKFNTTDHAVLRNKIHKFVFFFLNHKQQKRANSDRSTFLAGAPPRTFFTSGLLSKSSLDLETVEVCITIMKLMTEQIRKNRLHLHF